jgi:hypothetical protein
MKTQRRIENDSESSNCFLLVVRHSFFEQSNYNLTAIRHFDY